MLPAPTVPFVDPLFSMKESTKTSLTLGLVVFLIDPTNLCTIGKPNRFMDSRLPNKQEIAALLIEGQALIYDTDFLKRNPLYQDHLENRQVVILANQSIACRIYDANEVIVSARDQKSKLTDNEKSSWQATEEALIGPSNGVLLDSLPYRVSGSAGVRSISQYTTRSLKTKESSRDGVLYSYTEFFSS